MSKESGKNLVYGIHAVSALIRQTVKNVSVVYIDKNKSEARMSKLIDQLQEKNIKVEFCQRDLLQKYLGDVVHQGVMAVVEENKVNKLSLSKAIEKMSEHETVLILDGVQDPMNLGSCLRVADAAGVRHVIIPKDKSASLTAATRKVAVGAADFLHIHTVTNLVRIIEQLKKSQFWVVGMSDSASQSIYEYQFQGRTAIILGNEAKGLRQLTQKSCDELLVIPMFGQVESLNVATATAVSLFETVRQKNAL